jgi:tol-pal system protein YbgF
MIFAMNKMNSGIATAHPARGTTRGLSRLLVPAALLALAVMGAGITLAVPGITWAQARDNRAEIQALINRIDRLQREVTTLQRQVYKGGRRPVSRGAAGRGGVPSEPNMAAGMQVRLDDIETQMRQSTGKMEELRHGIDQVKKRLEKLASDVDFRLKALESRNAGTGGPGATSPGAVPLSSGAVPPSPAAVPNRAARAPQRVPGYRPAPAQPRVLGTVPLKDVARQKKAGSRARAPAQPASKLAPRPAEVRLRASPEAQYKYATGLLFQSNYKQAEQAFTAFLSAHPRHRLAGNAQYWLGETHYARCHPKSNPSRCSAAARAFADGYQKYPKSPKGPDNLLKLGFALAAINKKRSACASFRRLLKEYPKASSSVRSRARTQRKNLRCR